MLAIRGAITVEQNTREDILEGTKLMLAEIIAKNNLKNDQIIDMLFTATRDLTAAYPAVAARDLGIVNAGLLCFQEMYVEGSLEMCIRVLVHVNISGKQDEVQNIYLNEAVRLRPDLIEKE